MRTFIILALIAILVTRFCLAAVDTAIESAQQKVDNHSQQVNNIGE